MNQSSLRHALPRLKCIVQLCTCLSPLLLAGQLTASTVAYWRFEGDGTTSPTANELVQTFGSHTAIQNDGLLAADSSGNGNSIFGFDSGYNGFWIEYENNVPEGTVTQTGAADNWSIWTAPVGYYYPALATWSAQSHPSGTNIETITPKAWTIEASINLEVIGYNGISGYNHTFVGRDGNHVVPGNPNDAPLYFQVDGNNGNLTISYADVAGQFYTVQDSASLSANQWYNVAAVSDGTNLFLYKDSLDGNGYQLIGTTAETSTNTALAVPTGAYATMSDGSTWPWTLARGRYGTDAGPNDDHGDRFYGYLDEVRISDRALEPSQFLFAPTNVYVIEGPLPANQVIPQGNPVSFSVLVGGLGAQVQWQHAGTNILGATNLTYHLAATVAGEDGAYTVLVTNAYSSVISGAANLQFHTPANLTWSGTSSSWDTVTPAWTTNHGVGSLAYTDTDNVLFDPLGAAQPNVYLSGPLNPASIVVSNASYSLYYGSINTGSLLVGPGATLLLDSPDTSAGPTTIYGTLQVGQGDTGLTLPTGPATNDGTLLFELGGDLTVPQAINGTGSVTNLGSGGTLYLNHVIGNTICNAGGGTIQLDGSNTLSGGVVVAAGYVSVQSAYALGNGVLTIDSGAEFDIYAYLNLAGSPLNLAGGLLEKGYNSPTIFGGPVQLTADSEIHIDGGASLYFTNAAGLDSLSGNNLTLAGDGGSLGIFSGSVVLGAGAVTKNGDGAWLLAGTNNSWSGLSLNGNGYLQIGDGGLDGSLGGGSIQDNASLVLDSASTLNITNEIDGTGILTMNGSGTVILSSQANTYSGLTTVNGGKLLVNGLISYGGVTVNGGYLGGTGAINGTVSVLPGATLAPGTTNLGTLTLTSDLTLGGNVLAKVNKSHLQASDLVTVAGNVSNTNNGLVTIVNHGPALKVGDGFQLFSQPVSGGNTLVLSTAGGILWSNRLAVNGTVVVLSTNVPRPVITSLLLAGTNLLVSGSNGLASSTYYLVTTTNLLTPRPDWTPVATNVFDANGKFSLTNALIPGVPQSFYLLQLP